MENKTVFERLSAINVNAHVEKKKDLSYLSWAWAWSEVKKNCPDATYRIGETEYDDALGFMCHTTVTIEDETLEMWLPVMDGANKSMKKQAYTYQTRFGEKQVEGATTFDINKTIMRCLVKNLAMFGLGIYIYAGEDLPEAETTAPLVAKKEEVPTELIALKKGTTNWEAVVRYVDSNKELDMGKLLQQLERKYTISPAIQKELSSLLNK
jgi:hypothetical protein